MPKKLMDREALKTSVSQQKLPSLRGYKELKIFALSRLAKISLVLSLVGYLSAYQPALNIPPIKQSQAKAEFTQHQSITAMALPEPFQLPHPGYLSNRFATYHKAIDIATGLGMPVRPIAGGEVIEVSLGFWGLGHYVTIQHQQGYSSTYAHMGRVFAKKGEQVTTSSILGEVGMTGRTSGPHTHLELAKDGEFIDPILLLPTVPNYPTYASSASQQGNR